MPGREEIRSHPEFQSHHACLYALSVKTPTSKAFTWLNDKGEETASLTVSEVRCELAYSVFVQARGILRIPRNRGSIPYTL